MLSPPYVKVTIATKGRRSTATVRHVDLGGPLAIGFVHTDDDACVAELTRLVRQALLKQGAITERELEPAVREAIVAARTARNIEVLLDDDVGKRRKRRSTGAQPTLRLVSEPQPEPILSDEEARELAACEEAIERGAKAFVAMGRSLERVRDARLYRAAHGTFAEYLGSRWAMSRSAADRLIAASRVVQILTPIGVKPPATESVARPMAQLRAASDELDEQAIRETWQEASATAAGRTVTARIVADAVRRRLGDAPSVESGDAWRVAAAAAIGRLVKMTPVGEQRELRGMLDAALRKAAAEK